MQHEENNEFPWHMVSTVKLVAQAVSSLRMTQISILVANVVLWGMLTQTTSRLLKTQDETFTNTEMKVYADLDDKTKELLQVKHKEGKVEFINCRGNWVKKNKVLDKFYNDTVYRVV